MASTPATSPLLVLDLVASLAGPAPRPAAVILAVIAAAAQLARPLRDANRRGDAHPRISVAKLAAIAPDACRLH